jgi:hypothetical protein
MNAEFIRLYKLCRANGNIAISAIHKARIWTATYPDTSFINLIR